MTYTYYPQGVCSNKMILEVENGIISSLAIERACPGNTLGISKLVIGMTPEEVISRVEGIQCRDKGTSCPDQLAQALKQMLAETAESV